MYGAIAAVVILIILIIILIYYNTRTSLKVHYVGNSKYNSIMNDVQKLINVTQPALCIEYRKTIAFIATNTDILTCANIKTEISANIDTLPYGKEEIASILNQVLELCCVDGNLDRGKLSVVLEDIYKMFCV